MRTLLLPLLVLLFLSSFQNVVAKEVTVSGSNAIVLAYQRIGDRRHPKYISEQAFRAHLDYLQNNGFKVWPLERIVRRLRTGQTIPDKTVAITFDRTHPSIYEIAHPLLKARNWPYTVFVVPDKVDQIPRGNMSWDQMREMKKSGAAFANASINHIHMVRPLRGYPPRAWVHYVRDNIFNTQARLQEELGSDTNSLRLFSYPYGEYSTALANILAEIGFTSFGLHPGVINKNSDLRGLPRFLIERHHSSLEHFANRVNSVALEVGKLTPWNPHVTKGRSPKLTVELDSSRPAPKYLTCNTREGNHVQVTWQNKKHTAFKLSYSGELDKGYNYFQCTSRFDESQRLYWFSQPWVIARTTRSSIKTPEEHEAEEQAKDLKEVQESGSNDGQSGGPALPGTLPTTKTVEEQTAGETEPTPTDDPSIETQPKE
ncbi:MAG: polysaccharide deacetylase family protein [Gammaproteobacteria bacterium]|nr:polysaccharide deacetylase family protein [Gammaproteobacteria bacterium]